MSLRQLGKKLRQAVAFVASLVPLYYFFSVETLKEDPEVQAIHLSASNLISAKVKKVDKDIKIAYKDKDFPNVTIFKLRIKNRSEKTIRPDDFHTPITVTFCNADTIISAKQDSSSDPALIIKASTRCDSTVELEKKLFNPGQWSIIQIAVIPKKAGTKATMRNVIGLIDGIPVKYYRPDDQISGVKFWPAILFSSLAFIIFIGVSYTGDLLQFLQKGFNFIKKNLSKRD